MSDATVDARLGGRRVWMVTDGRAAEEGWLDALGGALRAEGAQLEVLGVPGAITATARGLVEQGIDAVARVFRPSGGDAGASDTAQRLVERRPELIVVDNPGAARVLVFLRDTLRVRAVVAGLVGTWTPNEPWSDVRPDALLVPDAAMLPWMARPDLPAEGRIVAGPPVPLVFAAPMDRDACRAEVASSEGARIVVLDATAFRPEAVDAWVAHLGALGVPFDLLIYHGGDAMLAERLRHVAAQAGVVARMFGPTEGFARIFAAADVIGTGGVSPLLEPIASLGRPLFSMEPRDRDLLPAREGALWAFERPEAAASWLVEATSAGPDPRHTAAATKVASELGTAPIVDALVDLLRRDVAVGTPGRIEPIGSAWAGPAPAAAPMAPVASGPPITREAALQQLAAVIREEKQVEERIASITRERDRWLLRAEMAREESEAELAAVADERLDGLRSQLSTAQERLDALHRRRDDIRRAVAELGRARRGGSEAPTETAAPARDAAFDMERRFREMEMKRELDRLRSRSGTGENE